MEQNLGERERRLRLGLGVVAAGFAVAAHLRTGNVYLTAGLSLAALGFIANYVTCFCGTKKMVSAAVNRLKEA